MSVKRRLLAAAGALALLGVLSGCGVPEQRKADSAANQEVQLQALMDQTEARGEDIFAQLLDDEILWRTEDRGGSPQQLSDFDEPWPKYVAWDAIATLKPEGARSPLEVSDGLDVWLRAQGWQLTEEEPAENALVEKRRYYALEGYRLSVRAEMERPPMAQNVTIGLTSPSTKP